MHSARAVTRAYTTAYTTAYIRAYTTAYIRAYTTVYIRAYTTAYTRAYTTVYIRAYTTAYIRAYTRATRGRSTYRIRYVFRPRLIKEGPPTYGILPCAPQRHGLTNIRVHVLGHGEKDWLWAGVDELRAIARGSRNAEIENVYSGMA